jgi:hypothetical protein
MVITIMREKKELTGFPWAMKTKHKLRKAKILAAIDY